MTLETYRTEEDQIDAIKRWWEKNGKYLIIALIFIFAGVVGGGIWKDYKQTAQFTVSNEFDAMMEELRNEKTDAALKRGGQLIDKHKESHYAIMSSLAMAKIEAEKGNLDEAKMRLSWALDNNDKPAIEHIIRLRLIRVLIATGELNEALTHTMQGNMSDFASEYSVLKGDIYRAQGEFDQARSAYQHTLQSDGATPQTKQLVQLKLDDLGNGPTVSSTSMTAPEISAPAVATQETPALESVATEANSAKTENPITAGTPTEIAPAETTTAEMSPIETIPATVTTNEVQP